MTKQHKIRWLSLLKYGFGSVVCLFALAYWWNTDSAHVEHEIEIIKARGEPWYLSDFVSAKVSPDENAAHVYYQAVDKIQINNADGEFIDAHCELPLSSNDAAKIDVILKQNAEALSLWRRATRMTKLDWECPILRIQNDTERRVDLVTHIHLGKIMILNKLARAAAYRAHEQRDEAEALDIIRSIVLSSSALQKIPSISTLKPAICVESQALYALHQLTWNLQLNSADGTSVRQLVNNMIRDLMDERELIHDYQWQLYSERAIEYCYFNNSVRADRKARGVTEARTKIWAYTSQLAQACTYPEVLRVTLPDISKEPIGNGIILSADWLQSGLETERGNGNAGLSFYHFRRLADRRMAAVALAIRLFVIDHDGYPVDLNELVNQGYIGSIPCDPMAIDSPIGYIAGGDHPRLYSVGENTIDDGGSLQMPEEYKSCFLRSKTLDTPFFLNRPIKEVEPESWHMGGYGGGPGGANGGGYYGGGPATSTQSKAAASPPR